MAKASNNSLNLALLLTFLLILSTPSMGRRILSMNIYLFHCINFTTCYIIIISFIYKLTFHFFYLFLFTPGSNNVTSQAVPTCTVIYNVDTGDTCDSIIKSFEAEKFSSLNPNLNCDNLFVGEYVCLNGTLST